MNDHKNEICQKLKICHRTPFTTDKFSLILLESDIAFTFRDISRN